MRDLHRGLSGVKVRAFLRIYINIYSLSEVIKAKDRKEDRGSMSCPDPEIGSTGKGTGADRYITAVLEFPYLLCIHLDLRSDECMRLA